MIELIDGELYQWDIGRKVKVTPAEGKKVRKMNFTNYVIDNAKVVEDITECDGYIIATVPNELLKQPKTLICYAVMVNPDGEQTIETESFPVIKKNRPDDYDINANTELRETLEKVLGETGGETIFDKLGYLKTCLDILYQSPPIKLMREVYGDNRTLKNCVSM